MIIEDTHLGARRRASTDSRRQADLTRIPLRAADARRSVKNILHWNTYLPPNCVRTMVRMGWDYTT
jgi:hypothetical protein